MIPPCPCEYCAALRAALADDGDPMPTKWNEPKGPAPSWLDPSREITRSEPKLPPAEFNAAVIDQLVAMGVPFWQAREACANALNETGLGRYYRGNNLGGWKITKGGAAAYEAQTGKRPMWWRAPGNKAPGATLTDLKGGDPPWCFYWGYASEGEYLAKWIAKFTPKPKPADTREALEKHREQTGNYKLTGFLFWAGDPAWFVALCDAGYKGANTDANPQPSYKGHLSLVRWSSVHYAQLKLGVKPDGVFGPVSTAACRAFQRANQLPETGEPDDRTLGSLALKR